MDMGETNYLILLAADTYDVPYKGRDDETFSDGSDTVFQYFLCSICPVKAPTLELKYNNENSGFHSASTGHIALPPELGFLFPAFDDRAANIYNALYYSRRPDELHQEFIDGVFHTEPPMSAGEQKAAFETALCQGLEDQCSMEVLQAIHERIHDQLQEHKERKDPEPPTLTPADVGMILADQGVERERIAAYLKEWGGVWGERRTQPGEPHRPRQVPGENRADHRIGGPGVQLSGGDLHDRWEEVHHDPRGQGGGGERFGRKCLCHADRRASRGSRSVLTHSQVL